MKNLKFLTLLFSFIFTITGYSSSKNYWEKVEEAKSGGLPRTAIEYLNKILKDTQRDKDYGEYLKALTEKIVLEATIEGNRPEEKVERLKRELVSADSHTKPLMQVILAQWYWHYYNRNRWRFMKRTPTENISDVDFTTWDLKRIFREIDSLYQDILKEKDFLISIPIEEFKDFLELGNAPTKLRPMLYDLVAHEAIDFYTRAEQIAALPEDAFEIDANSDVFNRLTKFLTYEPTTEDTVSPKFKAIRIFQSLLEYHLKDNNTEALVDVDLQRLRYVKNTSFGENKNKIYIQRLSELIEQYKNLSLSSLAAYYLAKVWVEEDDWVRGYEIAEKGYKDFPKSQGGKCCDAYMTELTAKSLKLRGERCIPPDVSKIRITYKNFSRLYFKVIPDRWDAFMDNGSKGYRYPNDINKDRIKKLLSKKPYKEWHIDLPSTDDLKKHSIEVDLPELEPGYYRIFASWQPDFKKSTMIQHTWIWVSNLTLVTRMRPGMIDGLVLDVLTGEPIEGALVSEIYRDEEREWGFDNITYTDSNGLFEFKRDNEDYLKKYLYIKKDNEEILELRWVHSYRDYPSEVHNRTLFFTDRSLYRPGQSIYFKGICVHIDKEGNNYEIIPNKKVPVSFYDANHEEIAEGIFTTNEFGSFSGQFTAPKGRLTGRMSLRAFDPPGLTSFRVEEYKRPKFTVEIESPKEELKLNEEIEVTGRAIAYTGATIDNASVRYRVVRETGYPYWGKWYCTHRSRKSQWIAHGRTKTDADGKFKITFLAKPEPHISSFDNPRFTYIIYADVTSPDGETRSGYASMTLGYSTMTVRLSTEDQPQNNKEFSILIYTQTLDGKNIPATAKIQIYRLKDPKSPITPSLWRDEIKGYDNRSNKDDKEQFSSNWISWPKDRMAYETNVSTKDDNPKSLRLKLSTGLYKVECISNDKSGNEVKTFLPLIVLPDWNNKKFDIKLPSVSRVNSDVIEVGKDLKVLWGTGYKKGRCFVEIEHEGKIKKRYWTNKNETQHTFNFPVTENFRGGFTVHLTQVSKNRLYIKDFHIDVPWDNKELSISVETFRNRLKPGEEESISLKISGKKSPITAAEMVVTMYDYSLDQFYTHSWPTFNFFKKDYSRTRSIFINGLHWFTTCKETWNESWSYPSITYPHFPNYIIKNYLYYQFPGSGKVSYSEERKFKGSYGKFIGTVVDAQTGKPLPGVNIIIEGTKLGTSAGSDGSFCIGKIPPGKYTVIARMMGYSPTKVKNVKSIKGKTTIINFELRSTHLKVKGVTVATIEAKPKSTYTGFEKSALSLLETKQKGKLEIIEEKEPGVSLKDIKVRRILNETAFFYPHLLMSKDGTVRIQFKCPETLTKWKFLGFVHSKKCQSGSIIKYAVTQKELMVQPNPPRFLREGDTIYFTTRVVNMSDKTQIGRVQLDFKDLISEKVVNKLLGLKFRVQNFKLNAHSSQTFSWKINVPEVIAPLSYTVVAKSKKLSDGEAGSIPVLSRRIFLLESFPLYVRGPQAKNFTFDRFNDIGKSETFEPYRFTLQMASNPTWYAIQALPYLVESPYECSEQLFGRLYSNSLAQHIANLDPRVREIFEQWRNTDVLKSNLEKNAHLKSVMLAETPWTVQAQDETQAKRNIGILFEENMVRNNLNSAFTKLKNMQLSDGSWPWFPGGKSNSYITLYITSGFGRLRHLEIHTDISPALRSIDYLDSWINRIYNELKDKSINNLSPIIAYYLYSRSFFLDEKPISPFTEKAVDYYLKQAEQHWLKLNSRLSQGHLALALNRFGRPEVAKKIMASIKERSVSNEEMGRFWREDELSWWWYRAPIETQALMIEAFSEVMDDTIAVEACKVWLLRQKQTQNWKTTKATADAVYALILRGQDYLSSTNLVRLKLGETELVPEKVEAGTGFYEKIYFKNEILPQFSEISVVKENKGIAWGGAYLQYFEDLSKITPHSTNLLLEKKIYVNRQTKEGRIIEPVTGALNVGDLISIRLVLRVDRDMEYVHLKDLRGSGLEPVDIISCYRYQDGLRYYQSTKDVATHFFVDYLPKGTYVFEYDLRVQLRGKYESGVAEIQCMYAPEFNSHSQSQLLEAR